MPNQNYTDPVTDPVTDPITDPVNFIDDRLGDVDLEILRTVKKNPGIRINNLFESVKDKMPSTTIDMIKNSIKRKLFNYIEFKGAQRNGGYYLKGDKLDVNFIKS